MGFLEHATESLNYLDIGEKAVCFEARGVTTRASREGIVLYH
jgi:hypothetical protein